SFPPVRPGTEFRDEGEQSGLPTFAKSSARRSAARGRRDPACGRLLPHPQRQQVREQVVEVPLGDLLGEVGRHRRQRRRRPLLHRSSSCSFWPAGGSPAVSLSTRCFTPGSLLSLVRRSSTNRSWSSRADALPAATASSNFSAPAGLPARPTAMTVCSRAGAVG